jgi:signal transduction histidine kinase
MIILLSIVISLLSIAMLLAGSLAFIRNPKNEVNKWFLLFCLFLSLWMPANFIDSNTAIKYLSGFALKLDFAAAIFIVWSFLFFVVALNKSVHYITLLNSKTIKRSTLIFNIILSVLALSGLLASSSIKGNYLSISYQQLFFVYALVIVIYFLVSLSLLFYSLLTTNSFNKSALSLVFTGSVIAALTNILTNLVFPIIITNNHSLLKQLNTIGYLGLTIMGLTLYVSITQRKLVYIQAIAMRSVAYFMSLITFGLIFTFLTFGLINIALKSYNLSNLSTRAIYTVLAMILAGSFPWLKKHYDLATKRIFYQNLYNLPLVIDKLNRILVTNYELLPLIKKVMMLLEETLKPTYVSFILVTDGQLKLIYDIGNRVWNEEAFEQLSKSIFKYNRGTIYADALIEGKPELYKLLEDANITIISKLSESSSSSPIGYLVVGPKRNGYTYNSDDSNLIEITSNELVLAVQKALRTEEIEELNKTLQSRIHNATHKLRATNEKLKALDEAKDDFVSMASHQLRTPLTSVKGNISLVLDGDAGKISAIQRQLLEQAFISSQRMVFLIADLLNVSRLKTGKFVIEPVAVNLADVIEDEVNQLIETAKSRHLTLNYSKPEKITALMLDDTKTRQVIMNFIDNAIYYTPSGGNIDVVLSESQSTIECRVVDNGIGVPRTEQKHLFTKFYRAANARRARPDGTGLGLFMAKKVIASEGGAIIFQSEEGKGSTFGFIFPKASLAVSPKNPALDTDRNLVLTA